MKISVPHFRQTTDYTCGPEVLRMISAFFGTSLDLDTATKLLETTPTDGTSNEHMIRGAKKLGFKVESKENSSISEIEKNIGKGIPVIVNYIEPEDNIGHYAVVAGIDNQKITLNDPQHGPEFSLALSEFEPRWKSGSTDTKRWLMAVQPKQPLFKSYFTTLYQLGLSSVPARAKARFGSLGERG